MKSRAQLAADALTRPRSDKKQRPLPNSAHLVVAGDTVPERVNDPGRLQRIVVDPNAATLEDMAAFSARVFGRITVVARHWAHVRFLMSPARLLGSTKHVVLLLTRGSNRGERAHDMGSLAGVQRLQWSREAKNQLRVEVRSSKALPLAEVLRAIVGADAGALRIPLRVALGDRNVERFAVGNLHSRYLGVDDITMTPGDIVVTNADLVVTGTRLASGCGAAAEPDERGRPIVRVLSRQRGTPPAVLDADPALVVPPVDTWTVNPGGHRWGSFDRPAELTAAQDGTWRIRDSDGVDLVHLTAGDPVSRDDIVALRQVRSVDCTDFRPGDAVDHASTLAQFACAGIPLIARDLPAEVSSLLGAPLCAALAEASPNRVADAVAREAVSVRIRRAALRAHGHGLRSRPLAEAAGLRLPRLPTISVLLVTKRPTFLSLALSQVARQTWPSVEIVLGLHGDHFAAAELDDAISVLPTPPTIVRIPEDVLYGEAMNVAADACTGSFIAKWDDDDLYGAEHLWDLMLAAEYSGATLVGKGAEFVFLEELGTIVRPSGHRGERCTTWLAGGTLLFRRQTLEDFGGWRPVRFSVDQSFIQQIRDVGGTVYRTHGLGYILRRHPHGHTWDPGLAHLLRLPNEQWRASPERQRMILECHLPPDASPTSAW